jgi:hypothetical protein
MADYYALIKKAVARLDLDARRESRWALYERARLAQITQLRTVNPPLSEAEIICEQLELEEAVRRVEAEAVRYAGDVRVPTLEDLVAAADDIGEPIARAESRSSVVHAKALTSPFVPNQSIEVPPMVVSGGATGRLSRYWRWRSLPPRSSAPNLASGR